MPFQLSPQLAIAVGILLVGALAWLLSIMVFTPRFKRFERRLQNIFMPLWDELHAVQGSNEGDFAAVLGRVIEENDGVVPQRLLKWYAHYNNADASKASPVKEEAELLAAMPRKPAEAYTFGDISDYVITNTNWCKKKLRQTYEKRQINYAQLDHYSKKESIMLIGDVVLDILLWVCIWVGIYFTTKNLFTAILMISLPVAFYVGRAYQRWHVKWFINRFSR